MSEESFKISVDNRAGVTVVHLIGSCNMHVAHKVGDALKQIVADKSSVVVINLSALDFIESTGLGGIVAGFLRTRRKQGDMRLAAPTPAIRSILEITRLAQLISTYDTVEQAVAATPSTAVH